MRMILIMERKDKRYISYRVSGMLLIKCDGKCSIEIACIKCGSDIVAVVDKFLRTEEVVERVTGEDW